MSGIIDADVTAQKNDGDWIYAAEAARILGVQPMAVRKMVLKGLLTTKKLPFTRVRVSRADVQRIADGAIQAPKAL